MRKPWVILYRIFLLIWLAYQVGAPVLAVRTEYNYGILAVLIWLWLFGMVLFMIWFEIVGAIPKGLERYTRYKLMTTGGFYRGVRWRIWDRSDREKKRDTNPNPPPPK